MVAKQGSCESSSRRGTDGDGPHRLRLSTKRFGHTPPCSLRVTGVTRSTPLLGQAPSWAGWARPPVLRTHCFDQLHPMGKGVSNFFCRQRQGGTGSVQAISPELQVEPQIMWTAARIFGTNIEPGNVLSRSHPRIGPRSGRSIPTLGSGPELGRRPPLEGRCDRLP